MKRIVEDLLATAFTKVAQHACRQGEKGSRAWPPLTELPAPENWKMVGQQYAKEFASELLGAILAEAFHKETNDLKRALKR